MFGRTAPNACPNLPSAATSSCFAARMEGLLSSAMEMLAESESSAVAAAVADQVEAAINIKRKEQIANLFIEYPPSNITPDHILV